MCAILNSMGTLLYIHPDTRMMMDPIIPMGVVPLMNSVSVPVQGRLWREVTDAEISGAAVIAMDLHWYTSLPSFRRLSSRVRRVAPRTPIIAGGYTASVFAPELVRRGIADYVVTGDADMSFPMLVDRLMEGEGAVADIPNVVSARQDRPRRWSLTKEFFDTLNYRDFDFMPAMKRFSRMFQDRVHDELCRQMFFPYVVVFRGCVADCPQCMGGLGLHRRWAGRGPVWRSPEVVRDDITWYINEGYHTLSFHNDFIGFMPDTYQGRVLTGGHKCQITYCMLTMPEPAQFERLLQSFEGGVIQMADLATETESLCSRRFAENINILAADKRYRAHIFIRRATLSRIREVGERLVVYTRQMQDERRLSFIARGRALPAVIGRKGRLTVSPSDGWWPEVPMPPADGGFLAPPEFDRFSEIAASSITEPLMKWVYTASGHLPQVGNVFFSAYYEYCMAKLRAEGYMHPAGR